MAEEAASGGALPYGQQQIDHEERAGPRISTLSDAYLQVDHQEIRTIGRDVNHHGIVNNYYYYTSPTSPPPPHDTTTRVSSTAPSTRSERSSGADVSNETDIASFEDVVRDLGQSPRPTRPEVYVRNMYVAQSGLACWRPEPHKPYGQNEKVTITPGHFGTYSVPDSFRIISHYLKDQGAIKATLNPSHGKDYRPPVFAVTRRDRREQDDTIVVGASRMQSDVEENPTRPTFVFQCPNDSMEGAALVLTSPVESEDFDDPDVFRRFVRDNAETLYRYANGFRSLTEGECLYFITGCDKSKSWAIAAYTEAMAPPYNELRLRWKGSRYRWTVQGRADVRTSSSSATSNAAENEVPDHCLFIRGFKLSFSQRFRDRMLKVSLGSSSKLEHGPFDSKPPNASTGPTGTGCSSGPTPDPTDSSETADGVSDRVTINPLPQSSPPISTSQQRETVVGQTAALVNPISLGSNPHKSEERVTNQIATSRLNWIWDRIGKLNQSEKGRSLIGSGFKAPSENKTPDPRRPFWAVIIGIDNYDTGIKINGAVNDANAINNYLQTELKVPPDQIVNLRDKEATRDKIIATFKGLPDHPRINHQDPILIYYSGMSEGGDNSGLTPVDYADGQIPRISPRTLAALISGISKKHGNNITVVLDCNGFSFSSGSGFARMGLNSVVLAACHDHESAREDKTAQGARGRFTTALLELLRTVPPDQLAYSDVSPKLLIDGQTPQCKGYHRNRILFDTKVPPPTRHSYQARFDGRKWVLEGGRAHGITDGAEFTLYRNKEVALVEEPLGLLIVKQDTIKSFATVLEPVDNLAPAAFTNTVIATQTKAGCSQDLLIHVPLESQYISVFEAIAREMSGTGSEPMRIRLVEKGKASLEVVAVGKSQFTFNVLEERATAHGFTRMPHVVDADVEDLHRILLAASHYHFYLNLCKPNNRIEDSIKIDFLPLISKADDGDNGDKVSSPGGENMIRGGKIEYEVDEDKEYGMKLTNDTPWNLYFYCFFFDHADFSITALPPGDYQSDSSVAEIGYGDYSYAPPLKFYIPDGLDFSIGFLKFHFTTDAIDLGHVPQVSPFSATTKGAVLGDRTGPVWASKLPSSNPRKSGVVGIRVIPPAVVWGTVVIPVGRKRKC